MAKNCGTVVCWLSCILRWILKGVDTLRCISATQPTTRHNVEASKPLGGKDHCGFATLSFSTSYSDVPLLTPRRTDVHSASLIQTLKPANPNFSGPTVPLFFARELHGHSIDSPTSERPLGACWAPCRNVSWLVVREDDGPVSSVRGGMKPQKFWPQRTDKCAGPCGLPRALAPEANRSRPPHFVFRAVTPYGMQRTTLSSPYNSRSTITPLVVHLH